MKRIISEITPIRRLYYRLRKLGGVRSQSDEGQIINDLMRRTSAPSTFVEFGFHPMEFNCIDLVNTCNGLLIDASSRQVADARVLLPKHLRIEECFLNLDNLDLVRKAFPRLGVLSIDIDGNDYWFLEKLIDLRPSVIAVEYNASFLNEPIVTPYDPKFERHEKHPSGWYAGASLVALTKLTRSNGYGLAAVSSGGMNAFFTHDGNLDPIKEWRPSLPRNVRSQKTPEEQWNVIKDLPYVRV